MLQERCNGDMKGIAAGFEPCRYLLARSGDCNTAFLKRLAVSLEHATSQASKSVACAMRFKAPKPFRHTVGLQNGVLITGVKKRHSTAQSRLLNHQKTPQNVFLCNTERINFLHYFQWKSLVTSGNSFLVSKWDEERKRQTRLMRLLHQSDRSLLRLVVASPCRAAALSAASRLISD